MASTWLKGVLWDPQYCISQKEIPVAENITCLTPRNLWNRIPAGWLVGQKATRTWHRSAESVLLIRMVFGKPLEALWGRGILRVGGYDKINKVSSEDLTRGTFLLSEGCIGPTRTHCRLHPTISVTATLLPYVQF